MKVLLRERARELRMPVVMETSDRGVLDVERFDLEPDRPLLHGRMDGMTSDNVAARLEGPQAADHTAPRSCSSSSTPTCSRRAWRRA